MIDRAIFENDMSEVIRIKDRCMSISFFAIKHYPKNNICVLDIKHVTIEEAYCLLETCFKTPNYNNHGLRLQILKILADVLKKRLSNTDGYIKSVQSTLGAAALIRSPYYEPYLDIRIAVACSWECLEKAKDFIFYELGMIDLRAMNPV
jgi:hypothetical protein